MIISRTIHMTNGIIFDIREFTVHDGPGIRTTVFLKGCPLACMWCHNPEGLLRKSQMMQSPAGTRLVGTKYSAQEVAILLNQQAAILKANEGGVTFSGGEPLLQARFVAEVTNLLHDLHIVLDTSGYGREQDFQMLLERVDLVYYDLKLIDSEAHRYYTGSPNHRILRNLKVLRASGVPFVIRVPLIPGVTDTYDNLSAIAQTVQVLPNLLYVNLLPYNQAAGAKYESLGMQFHPEYDETRPVNIQTDPFDQLGIKVSVA
jgi:pyruvate formate lyase activating enzyme